MVQGICFLTTLVTALLGNYGRKKLEKALDNFSGNALEHTSKDWMRCFVTILFSAFFSIKFEAKGLVVVAFLYGLSFGILLITMQSDWDTCLVYRFWWWMFGLVAVGMMICSWQPGDCPTCVQMKEWGLFCVLQYLLFARMYGRADCHGFACFSFLLLRKGGRMEQMLVLMLLSICFLGLVQLVKRNVNRKGNLKRPVPFLPYMTFAFLILW